MDLPSWRAAFNLLEGAVRQQRGQGDIAGTVESIAKSTRTFYTACYHTFYNLSNMVIAVAGNFHPRLQKTSLYTDSKESKPVSIESPVATTSPGGKQKEVVQNLDGDSAFHFG